MMSFAEPFDLCISLYSCFISVLYSWFGIVRGSCFKRNLWVPFPIDSDAEGQAKGLLFIQTLGEPKYCVPKVYFIWRRHLLNGSLAYIQDEYASESHCNHILLIFYPSVLYRIHRMILIVISS